MNSRFLLSMVGCASIASVVVGLADESKLPRTEQPIAVVAPAGSASTSSPPALSNATLQLRTYVYREIDGQALKAYVFLPARKGEPKQTPAILLFHGGGWSAGSAEWTFDSARRFAAWGMVAISIEYRLSKGDVTPIEALDDRLYPHFGIPPDHQNGGTNVRSYAYDNLEQLEHETIYVTMEGPDILHSTNWHKIRRH